MQWSLALNCTRQLAILGTCPQRFCFKWPLPISGTCIGDRGNDPPHYAPNSGAGGCTNITPIITNVFIQL